MSGRTAEIHTTKQATVAQAALVKVKTGVVKAGLGRGAATGQFLKSNYAALYRVSTTALIEKVRKGVVTQEVKDLVRSLGVQQKDLLVALSIPPSTFSRKSTNAAVLSASASERVLGVARLVGQVQTMMSQTSDTKDFDAGNGSAAGLRVTNERSATNNPSPISIRLRANSVVRPTWPTTERRLLVSQSAWRIEPVTKTYSADDKSGIGAHIDSGRWNDKDVHMFYCAESGALCCLETLVHLDDDPLPLNRFIAEYEIPADMWEKRAVLIDKTGTSGWNPLASGLPSIEYSTQWMKSVAQAVLIVRSIVAPEESNILLNPYHPDTARVVAKIVRLWTYNLRIR
jgi:RES domain-containing protein